MVDSREVIGRTGLLLSLLGGSTVLLGWFRFRLTPVLLFGLVGVMLLLMLNWYVTDQPRMLTGSWGVPSGLLVCLLLTQGQPSGVRIALGSLLAVTGLGGLFYWWHPPLATTVTEYVRLVTNRQEKGND